MALYTKEKRKDTIMWHFNLCYETIELHNGKVITAVALCNLIWRICSSWRFNSR